jgi:hypothetical protein
MDKAHGSRKDTEVGLLKALDERLNLRRISFRNVILLGHPRLPRAQSRPSANIGQVRIRLNSLCHAAPPQGDGQQARFVYHHPDAKQLFASEAWNQVKTKLEFLAKDCIILTRLCIDKYPRALCLKF